MNNLQNKKFLILGAKGMLGQDLANIFSDLDLILWDKEDIDITDKVQVEIKITSLKPDIIINCAAYTAVDDCEKNKDLALLVNSTAVGYLAEVAKKVDAVLVHISTDYVFNGQKQKGYAEDSQEFGPQNFYGESKLFGEKEILAKLEKYYLIRTSWLYGKKGNNFVETMLKLGAEGKELKVVNDQFGKPTYTVDLGKQILYILSNELPFGIYHLTDETNTSGISWYEFAQTIFALKGIKADLKPCSSLEFPRPAKRPAYSALINTKLPKMRNWEEALREYLDLRFTISAKGGSASG